MGRASGKLVCGCDVFLSLCHPESLQETLTKEGEESVCASLNEDINGPVIGKFLTPDTCSLRASEA